MVNKEKYLSLNDHLKKKGVTLVAVSKLKSVEDIKELYDLGQRDFGENYVQELMDKQPLLPDDIRWHFIGHLQSNKVKYIASFIHLIQSVDSISLLKEIDKQGAKHNRRINCLLQVHIAGEQTKFGFEEGEVLNIQTEEYRHLQISGLMGMASFTEDNDMVIAEFKKLTALYHKLDKSEHPASGIHLSVNNILCMGMSDDYGLAINCGSNMVRIGSLIFGRR